MVRSLLTLLTLLAIAALPVQIARADNPQIAYITNDARSIHLVDSAGDGDRPFFTASGTLGDAAWTPDGRGLAYTILDRTSTRPGQRLFLLDASSGKSTEIKSSVPTIGPLAFFPDGKRLATTSAPSGLGFPHCLGSQFLTLDVASGQATPGADSGCIGALQVAPDSAALIATHLSGAPASLVENVALGSGVITEITQPSNDVPFSGGGTVTANNQTLAYVARHGFDNSASSDLVLVDRDGSNPRIIWQNQLVDVAFAPDGSQLAVSVSTGTPTTESRNQSIWIIGSDGSNPHQIASGYLPAWRPGQGTAADAGASAGSSLTVDALDKATYQPVNADTFGPTVRLVNGKYKGPLYSDISQGSYVFGDLTGSGEDGAVAVVVESLSGVAAGLDVVLAVYVNDSGGPRFLDAVDLGHATDVATVTVASGIITVEGHQVGPNDPFCCPALPFVKHLKLQGTRLVDASGTAGPSPPESAAFADLLTDSVRADILAAVDRANAAWAAATQSLDPSGLSAGVAGQELANDQAELDKLRRQGQTRKNVNTAFAVIDVTLDAPGHAIVRTHETWYAEIDNAADGRLLQRTPSATYDETYTVEYLNGGWIVTKNDT